MKKILALAGLLCLFLTGCAEEMGPAKPGDGPLLVGNFVRVDVPREIRPMEYNDVLAADGMYYAAWSVGESQPYTNEDGDEAEIFDAQVYMVLSEKTSAENAAVALDEMLEMASSRYHVESTVSEDYLGQNYTVITYRYLSETNPYAAGAAAFAVRGDRLINVEVSCREETDDPLALLRDFLEGCRYTDEEDN